MMKKITLLLILLLAVSLGYSQATHTIDFEPAGTGSGWSWTAEESAPSFSEITNPVSGGINTSATVVEFIAYTTDKNWALAHTQDDGEFTFDGTNSTLKIMVYKPTLSRVTLKVEGTGPATELNSANTVINQWEELTFDASALIGQTYNKIVVIPDFVEPYATGQDRATDNTLYFDNIQVPDGVVIPEPTTAPTTPTEDAADVISMFSDAYTDVTVDTWKTGWSSCGALENLEFASNPVKKYNNLNYVGIETIGSNLIDASGMTYIHIDMWTPNATVFKIKLADWGADASYDGGDDTEHELTYSSPDTETWISYDIPLSNFTNLSNTDHMAQYILSAEGGTIYIDNIYFWKAATAGLEDLEKFNFSMYPNPANNFVQLKAAKAIDFVEVYDVMGRSVLKNMPNAKEKTLNVSSLSKGMYIVKIGIDGAVGTSKLLKQ